MPWNAVISTLDYWNFLFPNRSMAFVYSVCTIASLHFLCRRCPTPSDTTPPHANHNPSFSSFFGTPAFQSPALIGLFLVTYYGARFSFRSRIVPAFAITAAAMGAMPFVKDYVGSVALAALIGFIGTTASGSVFGMASVFAPRHISAVMTGQVRARGTMCRKSLAMLAFHAFRLTFQT